MAAILVLLLVALVLVSLNNLALANTPTTTTNPTFEPTIKPTAAPSLEPTIKPTAAPSLEPTIKPTEAPSVTPTLAPTVSMMPTIVPSALPTLAPTVSMMPTIVPSALPTIAPTVSHLPTSQPSCQPSSQPTSNPTNLIYNANATFVNAAVKDVNSAVFSGSVSAVVAALKNYDSQGDNKNVKYTAITSAIFINEPTMVDVIISTVQMDVNTQGAGSGNSFLMWASHWGNLVIVQSLIQQGADVTLKNKEGDTALSLAAKAGHRNIVAVLRANGATV